MKLEKILKESSYVKDLKNDDILFINHLILNDDKQLFNEIILSDEFKNVENLELIDDLYNIDNQNKLIEIQKHRIIDNIRFNGKCYLHSIWVSKRGISVLGIFEETKLNDNIIKNDTVNLNFNLGVIDILTYVAYESFVNGYKFNSNNKENNLLSFHDELNKNINNMKIKYFK